MIMEHVPCLVIVSLAGFWVTIGPFFFDGRVQYRSNMPSVTHLCRDWWMDAANTPLNFTSVYVRYTPL